MLLTKFVLNYIFLKIQDPEKETEFRFLLGSPTDNIKNEARCYIMHCVF